MRWLGIYGANNSTMAPQILPFTLYTKKQNNKSLYDNTNYYNNNITITNNDMYMIHNKIHIVNEKVLTP